MKKVFSALLIAAIIFTSTVMAFGASMGDINSDGKVNSTDALGILKYSVGILTLGFDESVADMNADGKINSTDALAVLRIAVGINNSDTMSKADIIKLYNDGIKAPFSQSKCVYKATTKDEYKLNKLLVDGKENPLFTQMFKSILGNFEAIEEKYTFYNGKTLKGEKATDIILLSAINSNKVQTATAVKYADGYKLTIVMKTGTESIKNDNFDVPDGMTMDDVQLTTTKDEIVAVTDAQGRIISIDRYALSNTKTTARISEDEGVVYMDIDVVLTQEMQFTY